MRKGYPATRVSRRAEYNVAKPPRQPNVSVSWQIEDSFHNFRSSAIRPQPGDPQTVADLRVEIVDILGSRFSLTLVYMLAYINE